MQLSETSVSGSSITTPPHLHPRAACVSLVCQKALGQIWQGMLTADTSTNTKMGQAVELRRGICETRISLLLQVSCRAGDGE